ncbi:T9SS type A sorting domain-containing protein [uncultured Planktosalinus sp.]|uniref:T9SS type A sorting domain-containing protein n=1 Tax=uncultured Planktosalinus sp. TaxID=1810935 RepID=UPI0030DAA35C
MKKLTTLLHFAVLTMLVCTFSVQSQERIAIIQSPNVILMDAETGVILDPSFIDLDLQDPGTPKAILQVGNEIWITHQIGDKIDRYDLDGVFLSSIQGGLDNIRGLGLVNSSEVWVTNAGTNNGAPGDAIVRFDFDGNNLGFFPVSPESDSPFDVIDNGNGEAYISYSSSNNIERRDYDGNFLGNIVEPGVVNFIQQIEIEEPGVILAAVFSGSPQNGVYRFSETDGSIIDFWSEGNLRGVAKLGNGEILWSSGAGIFRLDPDTGVSTSISGNSSQFFGRLNLDGCTAPPAPTGDTEQAFNEGATLADIVVDPTDVTWFATETDALAGTNPLPLNTVLIDGETYYAVNIVAGCLSDPFAVSVTVTLGVGNFDDSSFEYYPNPTNGIINFAYHKNISEITLSNLLGQTLLEQKIDSNQFMIDLSGLPNATYIVKVVSEEGSKSIRVIKK